MCLEYLADSRLRGSCNPDSWRRTASCICHNYRRSRSTARWRRPSNLKRETCHGRASAFTAKMHERDITMKLEALIRIASITRNYVHETERTDKRNFEVILTFYRYLHLVKIWMIKAIRATSPRILRQCGFGESVLGRNADFYVAVERLTEHS